MGIVYCPICHKAFKSLGYARHRAKHTDDEAKRKESENAMQRLRPVEKASRRGPKR